jgi:hypothetical protein
MNITSSTTRAFIVIFSLCASFSYAQAIQIGPEIRTDGGGLHIGGTDIGGSAPLRPLGLDIARPFEEVAKSIKDPFGYKQKAQEMEDQAIAAAQSTYASIVKEAHFVTIAVCLTLGFGFATLLFRRRNPPTRRVRRSARRAHA